MCTGNELDTDIPKDYSHFKEDVAAILKFIFEEDVDIQQVAIVLIYHEWTLT